MMTLGLSHYLIVGAILFAIGVFGFFRRCELSGEGDTVVERTVEGDRRLRGC